MIDDLTKTLLRYSDQLAADLREALIETIEGLRAHALVQQLELTDEQIKRLLMSTVLADLRSEIHGIPDILEDLDDPDCRAYHYAFHIAEVAPPEADDADQA